MGMDRILARLSKGQPPLRVGEFAQMIGCSRTTVRKMLDARTIGAVHLSAGRERRIPVSEALKVARSLRIID